MGLWVAVIGAGGVIVGALINTILSICNSIAQRKLDAALAVRQEKVNQYFGALDTLYGARDALQEFSIALSGLGWEDGKRRSFVPWRNRGYRSSDQASAEAFGKLNDAAQNVAIQRARIDVVGTVDAADSFESCYEIISEYLHEVVGQISEDGVFRAGVWQDYWDRYNEQISTTLKLFKRDVTV